MHETTADAASALLTLEAAPVALIGPSLANDHAAIENLSGHTGSNRSNGPRQIAADVDRDAVLAWLARYADNAITLANNRRDAERLLLWRIVERGKSLSSLTSEDLFAYECFLALSRRHSA